jgi:hypothetical protein
VNRASPDRALLTRLLASLAPAISGVVALVVYARTLMPGVGWGDWGEMPTVAHVLGVAHPTGYPTLVILGWLVQLVPIGTIAVRLNLLAAVSVAGTVATATAISLRLGVRPVIAIGTALAFGFIGTVWEAATVSDAHPLHLFFAALILHRALVWADDRRPRDLLLAALLVGLGLGNHLLMLFVVPFVVVYVVLAGWRELVGQPMLVSKALVAVVLGLGVYAYIPLAASGSPPLPYNHPTTLAGVVWLVSGQQFHGQFDFLSARGPGDFVASLPTLWSLAVTKETPLVPLLGLIGLVALLCRRPGYGFLLAVTGFFACYIWANYLELEHYLLVPWLVLAIAGAVALETFAQAGAGVVGAVAGRFANPDGAVFRGWRGAAGAIAAAVVIGLATALGMLNWAGSDRSADRSGQEYIDAVFGALPMNAAILSYWDASTPLWYGRFVEGQRPDVLIVDDTNIVYEGWLTRERRIESVICRRPVFILRPNQADLVPTNLEFDLRPFLAVRVAIGGPTAVASAEIYQVLPQTACG